MTTTTDLLLDNVCEARTARERKEALLILADAFEDALDAGAAERARLAANEEKHPEHWHEQWYWWSPVAKPAGAGNLPSWLFEEIALAHKAIAKDRDHLYGANFQTQNQAWNAFLFGDCRAAGKWPRRATTENKGYEPLKRQKIHANSDPQAAGDSAANP